MDITEKISRNIDDLPTLPAIFHTLTEALDNPASTVNDIADIISSDQASAFKVLKVANSPFFGSRGRIDTIQQAILHLGYAELRNIILALSVIKIFPGKENQSLLSPKDLWTHSLAVGICTRLLGSAVKAKNPEHFFLAGILHDIGKLLLLNLFNKEYTEVLRLVREKDCLIKDAEVMVLGIDHAIAGRLLSARWKLPQSILNAISYHHSGNNEGKPDTLISCVHIADIAVRMFALGNPGDRLVPEPSADVWASLSLSPNIFSEITPALISEFSMTVNHILDHN